jgi:hypothetical protein
MHIKASPCGHGGKAAKLEAHGTGDKKELCENQGGKGMRLIRVLDE